MYLLLFNFFSASCELHGLVRGYLNFFSWEKIRVCVSFRCRVEDVLFWSFLNPYSHMIFEVFGTLFTF